MPDKTARLDAHFAAVRDWRAEVLALRALLLTTPLTEDFKWRAPVYTWQGANVCIIWGFRDRCTLGFFKGVLLSDPAGILAPPGPNSRASRTVDFTDTARIAALAPVLRSYIDEAIGIETAGRKIEFAKDDLDYPPELTQRLKADPGFSYTYEDSAAFRARFLEGGSLTEAEPLTLRRKLILTLFVAAFPLMVWGVMAGGWWFPQMAASFLSIAIIIMFISGEAEKKLVEAFTKGASELDRKSVV